MRDKFGTFARKLKEWIELYIQKKQSPDTKKVSEFCFLNYIILQTISIIRMATDEFFVQPNS